MDLLQVQTQWELWCILQTSNGSTRSLVRCRGGHQIENAAAACGFHERLLVRFRPLGGRPASHGAAAISNASAF